MNAGLFEMEDISPTNEEVGRARKKTVELTSTVSQVIRSVNELKNLLSIPSHSNVSKGLGILRSLATKLHACMGKRGRLNGLRQVDFSNGASGL